MGKALKDVRKGVALATKLFLGSSEVRSEGSVYRAVRRHLEDSMDRLQTDMVDLYYLHRTSGGVRIEDIAEAMGLLIEDGLIRGWGLSQVDVDIIERAICSTLLPTNGILLLSVPLWRHSDFQ